MKALYVGQDGSILIEQVYMGSDNFPKQHLTFAKVKPFDPLAWKRALDPVALGSIEKAEYYYMGKVGKYHVYGERS